MSEDGTVLDHLLRGRGALQHEVDRLTAALHQLDSVIAHVRSPAAETAPDAVTPSATAPAATAPATTRSRTPRTSPEVASPARGPRSGSVGGAAFPVQRATGEAPKSIRIHVLEMLAAEDRDFGLAEIIDRVHDAGVQAHDDAVRSITTKLMKDGRVERVGRGMYRLARRSPAQTQDVSNVPAVTLPADADEAETRDAPGATNPGADTSGPEDPATTDPIGAPVATSGPATLNLGRPWT